MDISTGEFSQPRRLSSRCSLTSWVCYVDASDIADLSKATLQCQGGNINHLMLNPVGDTELNWCFTHKLAAVCHLASVPARCTVWGGKVTKRFSNIITLFFDWTKVKYVTSLLQMCWQAVYCYLVQRKTWSTQVLQKNKDLRRVWFCPFVRELHCLGVFFL